MLAAMALFIVNDAIVKLVAESLPTGELLFLRGLMATALIMALILAWGHRRSLPRIFDRAVIGRSLLEAVSAFAYLVALFHMPIATATSINMSAPLILTLLAALILREGVGWRRWSAVAVGFVGVLLVVRPSPAGVNGFALLALTGTFFYCLRDIATRYVDAAVPSIVVTLATSLCVTTMAAIWSLFEGWVPVDARELALLAAGTFFLVGGYFFIIDSVRHGEISAVAPFRYSVLLWSILLGFVIWGDVPDRIALAGMAILVASGLYILHRERVRARAR